MFMQCLPEALQVSARYRNLIIAALQSDLQTLGIARYFDDFPGIHQVGPVDAQDLPDWVQLFLHLL